MVFSGILHLLSARAVIVPFLAGVLAWRMISLQLRDSAGLPLRVTGFAFEPSHPGDRAPERLVYFACIVQSIGLQVKRHKIFIEFQIYTLIT